ncbi:MAG: hypothetical protein GXO22_07330 [Aquificae bacterium]|nr:hypothetical protein [Aquificota bacterium]
MSRKLKAAKDLYRRFHWGREPKEALELNVDFPKEWVVLGHVPVIVYLAKKGRDKTYRPYIHSFGKGEPFEIKEENGKIILEAKRDVNITEELPILAVPPTTKPELLALFNFQGKITDRGIEG